MHFNWQYNTCMLFPIERTQITLNKKPSKKKKKTTNKTIGAWHDETSEYLSIYNNKLKSHKHHK